jgi:hypothetical protein
MFNNIDIYPAPLLMMITAITITITITTPLMMKKPKNGYHHHDPSVETRGKAIST